MRVNVLDSTAELPCTGAVSIKATLFVTSGLSTLLLLGCTSTFSIPGFGTRIEKSDICAASDYCDVQGKVPVNLLSGNSSRRFVADPTKFVGAAFRPEDPGSLYGPLVQCGDAPPELLVSPPVVLSGTVQLDQKKYAEFSAALSAKLSETFNVGLAAGVDSIVAESLDGSITFERTIYAVRDDQFAAREQACRKAVCARSTGDCAQIDKWAMVASASIVHLSAQSTEHVKRTLTAKISASASLSEKAMVSGDVKAAGGIENAVGKVLETKVTSVQFAAYVGWNDHFAQ